MGAAEITGKARVTGALNNIGAGVQTGDEKRGYHDQSL
jgi:hypothetical protein